MRRTVVSMLVIALAAGALVAPAEAAKKKKKKAPALIQSEVKYFLHWPSDGATPEGCAGVTNMSIEDTAGDTTCSYVFQVAQEALAAAGEDLLAYTYPAADGVPFILDASRKLTGEIVLRGTITANSYVQLSLTGTVDAAPATLAEGDTATANGALSNSAQGQQLPGPAAVIPVDLEIDSALDKKQVTALMLTVTIRGIHRGGVDYEVTPSNIIIPSWK